MQTFPLANYGRRSFLFRLGKTGVLAGIGVTAYEILRQPETRRFMNDGLESLSRLSRHASQEISSLPPQNIPAYPLPHENAYGNFLKTLELRHISNHEVFSAHRRSRNGVSNSLPPENLWGRIGPALKLADELRQRLGVPLTYIASAYRCPDYNEQCPGAAQFSQHMQNRALDLVFACPSADAFAEARKMRGEGKFKGGLGLYPSFIHLDTRGHDATWGA